MYIFIKRNFILLFSQTRKDHTQYIFKSSIRLSLYFLLNTREMPKTLKQSRQDLIFFIMKPLKIIFLLLAIVCLSIPQNALASGGASCEPCEGQGAWTCPEGQNACGIIPTPTGGIVVCHPSLEETEIICYPT